MSEKTLEAKVRAKMKKEDLEPVNEKQKEIYAQLSVSELWLYYLVSRNQNLSVFISGIISSIPMTLLLNLVGTRLAGMPHLIGFLCVYAVMLVASGDFCIQSWKVALDHIKVDEYRQKNNDLKLREEDIYYMFKEFDAVRKHLSCAAKRLLFSGIVTTVCIVAIFVLINI